MKGCAAYFFDASSQHFALSGCSLQLGDRWVRLYAVHSATVADFLALKDVLQSMGQQRVEALPVLLHYRQGRYS